MPKTKNPIRLDPTRTTTLRRAFMRSMAARFRALRTAITRLVVEEDAFGLTEKTTPATGPLGRTIPLDRVLGNAAIVTNQRWQFLTDDKKLDSYRAWLGGQVNAGILGVDPKNQSQPWTQPYITSAYKQGVTRAYVDTHNMADKSVDFVEGGKAAFLDMTFNSPVAQSKLKLLGTRAFAQLEGVTAQMDQEMSRILAQGLASGKGAVALARELNNSVSGLEKKRALVIARTEVIHAHAEGQLDAFETMNVEDVGVMAEWSTAGDSVVCELCYPLEGVVMTVQEARGTIPRHPSAIFYGTTFAPYGRALELVRAWYDGPAISIVACGRRLVIGPNHPIVTGRGIMPAKEVRVGDKLLYDTRHDNVRPPLIEDVFQDAADAGASVLVLHKSSDMHGDAHHCQGRAHTLRPAPGGLPFTLPTIDLGVVDDDDRFAYLIVSSADVCTFTGWAYDGTTASGFYCNNGVVVKNCRCTWIPANVGEEKTGSKKTTFSGPEQGLEAPGTAPTGETVLQKRGKDEIEEAMRKSIKAEHPKLPAREAAAASRWVGADKSITGKLLPGQGEAQQVIKKAGVAKKKAVPKAALAEIKAAAIEKPTFIEKADQEAAEIVAKVKAETAAKKAAVAAPTPPVPKPISTPPPLPKAEPIPAAPLPQGIPFTAAPPPPISTVVRGADRAEYTITEKTAQRVKAAKSNGITLAVDREHIEDNNVLVWQELNSSGRAVTKAQFKVTLAGSEAIKEALKDEIGIANANAAAPAGNDIISSGIFKTIGETKQHINQHVVDGLYNKKTLQELDKLEEYLKSFRTSARWNADDKAMAEYYIGVINDMRVAKDAKKAIGEIAPYISTQQTTTAESIAKSKIHVTRTDDIKMRTVDFTKGAGKEVRGMMNIAEVSEGYNIDMGDGIIAKFIPSSGGVGEHAGLAMEGTVSITLPGGSSGQTMKAAIDAMGKLGLNTKQPTQAYEEALYLHRGVYLNNKHTAVTYKAIWEDTKLTDEKRVAELKAWVKENMGIDVSKVPGYDPAGAMSGGGFRHWMRWDLPADIVKKEMGEYSLVHTVGSLSDSPRGNVATALAKLLDSGGEFNSTVGRLRKGVPLWSTGGASPGVDIKTGGANYFFTRIKQNSSRANGFYFKIENLARQDAVSYGIDKWGSIARFSERGSTIAKYKKFSEAMSNETIFKEGLNVNDINFIRVRDKQEIDEVLRVFADRGIEKLPDGRLVKDIVVGGG